MKLRQIIFQTILHQLAKNVLSKKSEPLLSRPHCRQPSLAELAYHLACIIRTSRTPEPHHKVLTGPGERHHAILQANSSAGSMQTVLGLDPAAGRTNGRQAQQGTLSVLRSLTCWLGRRPGIYTSWLECEGLPGRKVRRLRLACLLLRRSAWAQHRYDRPPRVSP